MAAIVVIDDEYRQRDILKTILEDEGYEVHTASSAEEGLELIDALNPDVVITDLKMGGMSGVHLLECLPVETKPAVIIMTAFGTISSAVEAMKKGAFDYLTKPLEKDVIVLTVRKAMERMQLLRENLRLQDALFEKFKMEGIIGTSRKMREAAEIAKKVTPTAVTVLVYGESGTGKELIAKAIHYNSPRRTGPFTAINCAAIPDTLIESELFGRSVFLNHRTRVPFSSTRLETFPSLPRRRFCGFCRIRRYAGWEGRKIRGWMCGSSRRRTRTSKRRLPPVSSGRTCITD